MSDTAKMGRKREGPPGRRRPLVDDELADQLPDRAHAEGKSMTNLTHQSNAVSLRIRGEPGNLLRVPTRLHRLPRQAADDLRK
jgi:hypothetical protein